MPSPFRCTIVTPADAVLDEDVSYVTIPAWDGQQGVLGGQSPLLTRLGIGSLRVDLANGGKKWFLVEGGFAQMRSGVLTVLTERATDASGLSLADAEAELRDANARATTGGESREQAEADQQRARVKKALAQATGASSN